MKMFYISASRVIYKGQYKEVSMSRRGENIRRRKDGRWEARVILYENGKKKYHSIYGHSYSEVKQKKSTFQLDNVYEKPVYKENDMSMEKLLNSWLSEKELTLKKSALLKYKTIINLHIIPELGSKLVNKITIEEIDAFLSNKLHRGRKDGNGGLSKSYIKTMSIIILSSLNFAVSIGIRDAQYIKISKISIEKRRIVVLNNKTQRMILESLSPTSSTTELGIIIALNTGLRIGEVCALRWDDIDLQDDIIHVRHSIIRVESSTSNRKTELIIDSPKTSSSIRDIPINTTMKSLLIGCKFPKEDTFILSGNSNFISPRTFEYRFHKVLNKYNIPDFNFHTLRHTFATRCIECGVDVKTLSEILGHSNVNITLNNYIHPSFEAKRIQMEKLDEF